LSAGSRPWFPCGAVAVGFNPPRGSFPHRHAPRTHAAPPTRQSTPLAELDTRGSDTILLFFSRVLSIGGGAPAAAAPSAGGAAAAAPAAEAKGKKEEKKEEEEEDGDFGMSLFD
jgi:ribosomal protein L12E/L44/L45/RPP1/RPP2